MAAKHFAHYRALIRELRKSCPPAFPVSVRRVQLSQHVGRCWKTAKKFHIEIDNRLDENNSMDVLIHEWAHACALNHRLDNARSDEEFNRFAHDAAWGVAYAEVYTIYERHILTHMH